MSAAEAARAEDGADAAAPEAGEGAGEAPYLITDAVGVCAPEGREGRLFVTSRGGRFLLFLREGADGVVIAARASWHRGPPQKAVLVAAGGKEVLYLVARQPAGGARGGAAGVLWVYRWDLDGGRAERSELVRGVGGAALDRRDDGSEAGWVIRLGAPPGSEGVGRGRLQGAEVAHIRLAFPRAELSLGPCA